MGKGHYRGGSTIIRPGSNWFSYEDEVEQAPPRAATRDIFRERIAAEMEKIRQEQAKIPQQRLIDPVEEAPKRGEARKQKKLRRKADREQSGEDLRTEALSADEVKKIQEERIWNNISKRIEEKYSAEAKILFKVKS